MMGVLFYHKKHVLKNFDFYFHVVLKINKINHLILILCIKVKSKYS